MFVVRWYFKNQESIVQTQRDFLIYFDIPRHGTISNCNTILRRVKAFNTTGMAVIKITNERNRTINTPENAEKGRLNTLRSPKRSVRFRAVFLGVNELMVLKLGFSLSPLNNSSLLEIIDRRLPIAY